MHVHARLTPMGRLTLVMRIESARPVAHVAVEMSTDAADRVPRQAGAHETGAYSLRLHTSEKTNQERRTEHEQRPEQHPEPRATVMTGLALITGASSGIGRAFARRLGAEGYDLVVVGRRRDRLEELTAALPDVEVRPLVADLGTDAGVGAVAEVCAARDLTVLVNNASVAHYMPFVELPADKANELLHVKVVAPTMLTRAAAPGMVTRGEGTIINVSGMLAFSGPASLEELPLRRAVYTATLAHIVALSQSLHEELAPHGLQVQALCPGVVATEFHERQGLDLRSVARMSADDVVTASLRGLELGEVVCAPGVVRPDLLDAVSQADLAAFRAQTHQLAERYQPN